MPQRYVLRTLEFTATQTGKTGKAFLVVEFAHELNARRGTDLLSQCPRWVITSELLE